MTSTAIMIADKVYFKNKVKQWVYDAFKDENFTHLDVEITGRSGKGDGYIGDIAFIKLTAVKSNGNSTEFNLVVKYGKLLEDLRERIPVRSLFEREIFVYRKVSPIFRKFQERYNVKLIEQIQPKCFNAILYEKEEVVVLQDLKCLGYDLHDRKRPMDLNHLKLSLETYGKWHGLSMAYRDQNPKAFKELFSKGERSSVTSSIKGMSDVLEKGFYELLERNNEVELAQRLRSKFPDGFDSVRMDLLRMKEEDCVCLHGDCWNNNMMFQYDKEDKERPLSVLFLDFQLSHLGSPVMDLAYHLYSTSSAEELRHFKNLLRIYHSSLSITIRQLGSDPEKVFPYEKLVRQWRKYSAYGVISCPTVLLLLLWDKEELLDIQDLNVDAINCLIEKTKFAKEDRASARAIAVVKHFLDCDDY